MKLLRIVPLALAVTFTSSAFADTPKKDAPPPTKDAKDGKDDKAPPPKKDASKPPAKKDSAKDAKDPAAK